VLLRTPQYDDFYCRKLLEIGCLDHHNTFHRQRACTYIQKYEDREINNSDSSSEEDELEDDSGEDMDMETDYDDEDEQID
jgi:hypothetical protein